VSLTPEGETFLPYATSIVEAAEAGRAVLVPSEQGATGLLRATVPAAFGRKVVMPIIPALLAENPGLSIDLELSDGVTDLISRGMDVAIRIAPLRDSGLIARKLAENRRVLCAAPAYLDRRGRPWQVEDLVHHDCITLSGVPYWPFVVAGRHRLVRVVGRFSSNSVEGTHEACVGGVGLALLSTWDVAAELSDGKLVSIDLNEPVAQERAIWAVYPKARHTLPKLHVFLSRLQERVRI